MLINQGFRLAKIGSTLLFLKASLQNPFILRQLEIALNKLIHEQPQTHQQLDALHGKIINIVIDGFQLEWHLLIMDKQILINPGLHSRQTVNITIQALSLPRFILKRNQKHPVQLEGDIAAVLQLQGLSTTANLDLYPTLMYLFGSQAATLLIEIKELVFEQFNRRQTQLGNAIK